MPLSTKSWELQSAWTSGSLIVLTFGSTVALQRRHVAVNRWNSSSSLRIMRSPQH
jgi:hypothetical protein